MTPQQDITTQQNHLCSAALDAEQARRPAEAVPLYREAIRLDDSNPTPYLFYGYALQSLGRNDAAVQAWSLGADLDSNFINAWRSDGVDELVRQRSRAANDAVRSHFTSLHAACMDEFRKAHPQADIQRIDDAIWCQTHDRNFKYRHPEQQPHLFYVPDLEPIPVYSAEHAPWFGLLEDAWGDICDEFLTAQRSATDEQSPYLGAGAARLGEDWAEIADSLNWGSFHLYKQGEPNPTLIEMFPRTLEVLEQVPMVLTPTGPSELLFSVLQGEQRIPPHFGVANTDMTVHLPIVFPGDAAIRVIDEVYEWQPGKAWAFDDAFSHESWNNSAQPRVNLLFEAWHPHLSKYEQQAVMATFQARLRWNAGRSLDHPGL
jgi:aspartyl/asparaginyl beta-hydroxylase (cupin superfamily)